MNEAEPDVVAFISFPKDFRRKIHSINPLERLNGEIKRWTDAVGIFPNEDAITRPIGALLLEQNDEWAVQRGRYMTVETIVLRTMIRSSSCHRRDNLISSAPAGRARLPRRWLHHPPAHAPEKKGGEMPPFCFAPRLSM